VPRPRRRVETQRVEIAEHPTLPGGVPAGEKATIGVLCSEHQPRGDDSMQAHKRAEMNYRRRAMEHLDKVPILCSAADAAKEAGDRAAAKDNFLQALAHECMANHRSHRRQARP
jgi:hypothetical protein